VNAIYEELAELGSATVYEAAGRVGLVDLDLVPLVPGARAAGPARTVRCGQADNLMVHAVMSHARPGDVLVLTMPEPAPFALFGDLLATQASEQGAAAVLVDASVRDVDDLAELGLPVWARYIRIQGATKQAVGEIDVPVVVGGATIRPGDAIVLDGDGIAVVPADDVTTVLDAAHEREAREAAKREQLQTGRLSYDLDGLRAIVEGA
jgi:4-hydroxy-4-methyl-2-oxoglutarate aldolase